MSAIDDLAKTTGSHWSAIHAAAEAATTKQQELAATLNNAKLIPPDTAFIMFGSLARNEFTRGSDLDWTLLVDGQSDTKHLAVTKAIKALVETGNKPPGPTALFGTMAFSHELVHLIGGDADSNRNMTRRILLLLESRGIVENDPVRNRVLRNVLMRYLQEDLWYHQFDNRKRRVPRFLINDIARLWRTMAVDYANKRRDREQGWALRHIKLRLSRKLIFTAGLAMCMSCQLFPSQRLESANETDFYGEFADYLIGFSNKPPLHVIAEFVQNLKAYKTGKTIFDAYDKFLTILLDSGKREHLEKLSAENASKDREFRNAREVGKDFQTGLTKLFFETNEDLTTATQRYGVF